MILKSFFKKATIFILTVTLCFSCDDEFTAVGVNVVGGNSFNASSATFPVVAYTKALNPVQTNGLSSYKLGVNTDPNYGTSVASIVTQVTPSTFRPSFGANPKVESVTLNIPYFSTLISTDANGNSTYKLDSVFGEDPIKLSIYENKVFLKTLDPSSNSEENQKYYSNGNSTINFDDQAGQLLYTNDSYIPSNAEITFTPVGASEATRLPPSLRVELLNTDKFWDNLLFTKEGEPELSNANNFRNYFRGLYIKAESVGDGHVALLNILSASANLVVNYSFDDASATNGRANASYQLNISGVKVNLFENNYNAKITDGDKINGDKTLYLKGGEGAMAVIDLFNGQVVDENGNMVDAFTYFNNTFKNENGSVKRLINEANLVIYTDKSSATTPPYRLYLYNLTNSIPLIDYISDPTAAGQNTDPRISHVLFASPYTEDDNGIGRYKFRITEHINNILTNQTTNVKLGLVVTTNIVQSQNAAVLTDDTELVQNVPISSVQETKGVILHGSNKNVPDDLRLKLEIFYSELK